MAKNSRDRGRGRGAKSSGRNYRKRHGAARVAAQGSGQHFPPGSTLNASFGRSRGRGIPVTREQALEDLAFDNAAAEMELTISNYERVHELLVLVRLHYVIPQMLLGAVLRW